MSNISWTHLLIHLALYPVYQILGTVRHELSHALAGWASHIDIKRIRIFPHREDGKFYWGRVLFDPVTYFRNRNVHVALAPYYTNLVCIIVALALYIPRVLQQVENPHLALFAAIMLVVSPIFDTAYNIWKSKRHGIGDFAQAVRILNEKKAG